MFALFFSSPLPKHQPAFLWIRCKAMANPLFSIVLRFCCLKVIERGTHNNSCMNTKHCPRDNQSSGNPLFWCKGWLIIIIILFWVCVCVWRRGWKLTTWDWEEAPYIWNWVHKRDKCSRVGPASELELEDYVEIWWTWWSEGAVQCCNRFKL